MPMRPILAALAALALAGCELSPELSRYSAPRPEAGERVGIAFTTVMVREVSLPSYASVEEILVAQPDGRLQAFEETLWADSPPRAVTLGLTAALAEKTRARVAPEPWPFGPQPEAVVDVRMEEFVATAGGQFRAVGQVFVAPAAEDRAERARSFEIEVPFDPEGGFPAIARARSAAVTELADLIARRTLR